MKIIHWRLHRLIKTSLATVLLITVIYIISMIVFKYRELRCSNEESLKIIDDLCKNYTDHKLDGNLCDAICYSRNIIFKKCINYRLGKQVLLAECNGICEEGKTITAVIKTRTMEGRHFEPLNLDTYTNKSLTAESMEIAKTVMNSMISSSTLKTYKSVKDIFTKLWTTDFTSFVKNAKYPGADVVAMESLWSLINQDEFLFMSVFQDVPFIPKIYGSCGAYYMTEFAPPGQILSPNFFNAKEGGMWKKRVDIALGILDISSSLDIDFHEPLHFCDVKEENFGINSNNQVKILDTDSLFFDTSMMKDLSEPKCKTHDDCDFFDCRGWCDVKTHQCVAKRTNNNIQNICEDIFIPRAVNFYTGLLYNPPAEIATELKQLLEECAYPNKNKGEIVRSPTPINVYWKLISLLKRNLGLGFMVFNATFNNISVIYRGGQFYIWRKLEFTEKTTDLPQVTEKLYHMMLYSSSRAGVKPTTSVTIDTDCIGSCKSNYHSITATIAPQLF